MDAQFCYLQTELANLGQWRLRVKPIESGGWQGAKDASFTPEISGLGLSVRLLFQGFPAQMIAIKFMQAQ